MNETSKKIRRLQDVMQMAFDVEAAALARASQSAEDLRAQISDVSGSSARLSSDSPISYVQQAILHDRWRYQRKLELNMQLAQALAATEMQKQKTRYAFGRKQVTAALLEKALKKR